MDTKKIADIISYIIIQGIFLMLFIYAISKWGFNLQLLLIFPVGSHVLYFRARSDLKENNNK